MKRPWPRPPLRNRIAHTYGDLDVARLIREMPQGLDRLATFLAELTPSLVTAPAP